uniref:Transposon protein, putative, CACTA, En/Spm sub-class n=1 Tax=Oryza sativa subsp. japonica TaxID=39947 RepID=Q7XGZ3_ORYSJ|nr:transposon protein, putative, CACTA, En/Spm sub-class [Oryza sativa Japonica Group]
MGLGGGGRPVEVSLEGLRSLAVTSRPRQNLPWFGKVSGIDKWRMDRQWMYADRRSKEFIDGVHYFLRVAKANRQRGFICCPCNKCKNQKEYSAFRTIHFHLFESGFMPSYNCWTSHGEQGVEMEEDEVEDDNIPDFAQYVGFEGNQTGEEEIAADGNDVADDLGQMLQDAREDCERAQKVGYHSGVVAMEGKKWVSDKAFGDLLKLVKNILPGGNKLPETTYEAKKIVCPLGLEVHKIHACPNDCILYRGEEYENLEACPVCKALRYKIRRDDPGEVDGQLTKKRIPAKVMWYFPIIPRLRRLFRNKGNARMLRWHAEERQQDGMLRHPADGSQWRNIDRKFKEFGKDARNIRFGLSTDGMNPFGEMSSGHSTWPVTMCIYNLPPWLCMKRKYIMMPIIIQGPKQPGNDIDVYLRPLVEDLKQLWKKEGVPVWDEDKQEEFNLRALLFVTINDWPALSNLSGQSNKGYKACTHCMDETESMYLKHCRKVVYMGHRRFLAANHPVRKKGKHFEHKADHRTKPKHRSGKTVFAMVKDLKVVFGKGPGSQHIESEDGHAAMWKKNSIFWELPYWEFLDVRHAIDVMHLTKNLCVNLLGFLGVYGKSKDTLEARNDLKHMEQRGDLHPEPKEKGDSKGPTAEGFRYWIHRPSESKRRNARPISTRNRGQSRPSPEGAALQDVHTVAIQHRACTVNVYDSMDKKESTFDKVFELIDRAWYRFRHLVRGKWRERLRRKFKFPCAKQKQGTNLCGYYVCEYCHCLADQIITTRELDFIRMRDNLTTHKEFIAAVQEQLMGFINEEILDPKGEFYYDGNTIYRSLASELAASTTTSKS